MSEQANQLHHPHVMFNERKITFNTLLHSCDKHAVFFCVGVIGIQSGVSYLTHLATAREHCPIDPSVRSRTILSESVL